METIIDRVEKDSSQRVLYITNPTCEVVVVVVNPQQHYLNLDKCYGCSSDIFWEGEIAKWLTENRSSDI